MKFTAPLIFDGYSFRKEHVLITDEKGRVQDLLPVDEAGEEVRTYEGILSPGLINCHCHLELSHMKGRIPEKTGLVDFVFAVVSGRQDSTERILEAITQAEGEMMANGIVAVGDICNNTSTIAQKRLERLDYLNFIEASGWLPSVASSRMERVLQLYREFEQLPSASAIVPHAPYSVSAELWQHMMPGFRGRTITMHNQETLEEDAFFRQGKGDLLRMYEMMQISNDHHQPSLTSSLQTCFPYLSQAKSVILVHNTFTSPADVSFIQNQHGQVPEVYFCFCLNANRYIEDALPPVEMILHAGGQIVLGTDSLASNWSLDIMSEIRAVRKSFPSISIEEILRWATINGAKALDMQAQLGSFEKGKTPGIVMIDEANFKATKLF